MGTAFGTLSPSPARVQSRAGRPGVCSGMLSLASWRIGMSARWPLVALFVTLCGPAATSPAEEPAARVVTSHGYTKAVELKLGKTRAVLCPQAGGRVLEFSAGGTDAMYFDEGEKNWKPGKPEPI